MQVVSSVIAAWSDLSHLPPSGPGGLNSVTSVVATLNVGYFWMFANCLTSATYVRIFDKRRRSTVLIPLLLIGFGDAEENQSDRFL